MEEFIYTFDSMTIKDQALRVSEILIQKNQKYKEWLLVEFWLMSGQLSKQYFLWKFLSLKGLQSLQEISFSPEK